MKSTQILAVVAVIALVGAAVGIAVYSNNNNSEGEDLSVVYLNKSGYETIMIAKEMGYFDKINAKIELKVVSGSGADAVNAVTSGSAHLAATGDGPAINMLNTYRDDAIMVGGVNCSTGGQVWVAGPHMTGSKAIVPFDDNNKEAVKASWESAATACGGQIKVGVQQGATTESEFKAWLKAMNISFDNFGVDDSSTVKLINIKANLLVETLASSTHDIDVLAASQPYPNTALDKIPGSYKLGSNADINSYGVSMFVTTKTIFDQKENAIKEFMKAMKMATDYMSNPANEEKCVKICADAIGTTVEIEQSAFDTAEWKTCVSEKMINAMYNTAQKKGFSELTKSYIEGACPLKNWLDKLYA